MQQINPNTLVIMAGIGLAIIEVALGAATGFELLIIGVIFVLSGIIGIVFNSFTVTIISIVVLCLLYILFGRTLVKTKLHIETKNTNIDDVIGRKAQVTKKITPSHAGQVKVEGEIWRATADKPIAEGETVIIDSVSGVTLSVSKK